MFSDMDLNVKGFPKRFKKYCYVHFVQEKYLQEGCCQKKLLKELLLNYRDQGLRK